MLFPWCVRTYVPFGFVPPVLVIRVHYPLYDHLYHVKIRGCTSMYAYIFSGNIRACASMYTCTLSINTRTFIRNIRTRASTSVLARNSVCLFFHVFASAIICTRSPVGWLCTVQSIARQIILLNPLRATKRVVPTISTSLIVNPSAPSDEEHHSQGKI